MRYLGLPLLLIWIVGSLSSCREEGQLPIVETARLETHGEFVSDQFRVCQKRDRYAEAEYTFTVIGLDEGPDSVQIRLGHVFQRILSDGTVAGTFWPIFREEPGEDWCSEPILFRITVADNSAPVLVGWRIAARNSGWIEQ